MCPWFSIVINMRPFKTLMSNKKIVNQKFVVCLFKMHECASGQTILLL